MTFVDPLNPTIDELRKWASDPGSDYPDEMPQDWDLVVADWSRIEIIIELATADGPKQAWFLALLYLLAGDCVRSEQGQVHLPQLHELLARLEGTPTEQLALFRERALKLLAEPSTYDYDLWGSDGAYAYLDREGRRIW